VRVFLSYRRDDVGGHAGRLSDALVDRLGRDQVFYDVTAIGAGRDFTMAIDQALASSDATLAVIGPGWLRAATADGSPRLFEPDDFVRRELACALASGLPVVPVLVGGAALPAATELPDDLAGLTGRQAVEIRDEAFHADVDHLIASLEPPRSRPSHGRARLLGALLVLAVVIAAGAWWWTEKRAPDADDGGLTGCPGPSGEGWTSIALDGSPSAELAEVDGSVRLTVNEARWRHEGPADWDVVLTTAMLNQTNVDRQHAASYYKNLVVAKRAFDPWCFDTPREKSTSPGQVADAHIGFLVTCAPVGAMDLVLTAPASSAATTLPLTARTVADDVCSAAVPGRSPSS